MTATRGVQHSTAAGTVDYQLSPQLVARRARRLVVPAGDVADAARSGPALRAALEHGHKPSGRRSTSATSRTFIPSFGFGGTSQSQDVGVGFRTPLFHDRHVLHGSSAVFRDDQPLNARLFRYASRQLPLRSLRMHTILGWEPQPWMRLEAFFGGSADQPPRRRLRRSQPRRFPGRDFQAHEDAVMDEPRFDPLDYVSVFNRRKWWFIVPVTLA